MHDWVKKSKSKGYGGVGGPILNRTKENHDSNNSELEGVEGLV